MNIVYNLFILVLEQHVKKQKQPKILLRIINGVLAA